MVKMEPHENFLLQYLAAYSSSLNVISSGLVYGWSSPALPILLSNDSAIPFTDDAGSWLAVMPTIGALLGSTIGAFTVDLFGRRRMILISTIPFFLSWILIALAESAWLIFAGRFLAGMSDGISFTSLPMYLGEISDPSIRGRLGSCTAIMFLVGLFTINAIGLYLSIPVTAFVCSSVPVLTFISMMFMPESPYYFVMRNKMDDALRCLQKFRGTREVQRELSRIVEAIKAESLKKKRFWDLFAIKENRKAIFIMMLLRGTQQFSGHISIIFYAETIIIAAGAEDNAKTYTLLFFFVHLLVTLLSSALVDRVGRRPLLINSCIASVVFLVLEGAFFYIKTNTNLDVTNLSLIPIIGLILFITVFSLGMSPIPMMMLAELFSSEIKAYSLWYSDVYFSVVATVSSKYFQWSKDSIGMYAPFFGFAACGAIGSVLIAWYVPETKGKTLEDIQVLFRGGKVEEEDLDLEKNDELRMERVICRAG